MIENIQPQEPAPLPPSAYFEISCEAGEARAQELGVQVDQILDDIEPKEMELGRLLYEAHTLCIALVARGRKGGFRSFLKNRRKPIPRSSAYLLMNRHAAANGLPPKGKRVEVIVDDPLDQPESFGGYGQEDDFKALGVSDSENGHYVMPVTTTDSKGSAGGIAIIVNSPEARPGGTVTVPITHESTAALQTDRTLPEVVQDRNATNGTDLYHSTLPDEGASGTPESSDQDPGENASDSAGRPERTGYADETEVQQTQIQADTRPQRVTLVYSPALLKQFDEYTTKLFQLFRSSIPDSQVEDKQLVKSYIVLEALRYVCESVASVA
jgi:hypothetical protein